MEEGCATFGIGIGPGCGDECGLSRRQWNKTAARRLLPLDRGGWSRYSATTCGGPSGSPPGG